MDKEYKRAGVILICNNEILLVKGKKTGKWSFPKGHKEKDENAYSTAHRELFEETGIVLEENLKYVKILTYYKGDYVYFVYNIDKKIISPCIHDNHEVLKVEWVNIEDLKTNKYNKNCTLSLYVKYNL